MPAKIISATKEVDGYHFKVLLDTEKVSLTDDLAAGILAGEPDPAWIKEWTWGLCDHLEQHGQPLTEEQYLANIEAMLPEMIAREIALRTPVAAPEPALLDALHGKEIN